MRPLVLALLAALVAAACLSTTTRTPSGPTLDGGFASFHWDDDWGSLPGGLHLGSTHGAMVVDSQDRVFVNTDTSHAVVAFDLDGNPLFSWGEELRGGLHGMCLHEEDGEEFLYLVHTGRGEYLRTTLDGDILFRRGWPEESALYTEAKEYRPTSIAVAPDGTVFVADGYGKSYVHRFTADGTYLDSFGGSGDGPGEFHTCHGIAIDESFSPPRLLVADRENHRLQAFDLDGTHLATYAGNLRRPCSVSCDGERWLIADLAGRVTILDREGGLVAHLGDQPREDLRANFGATTDLWRAGEFLAPHGATWDRHGNVYVVDWNRNGRLTKLVKQR